MDIDFNVVLSGLQKAGAEHPDLAYLFKMQEELAIEQGNALKGLTAYAAVPEGYWEDRWLAGKSAVSWEDLEIDWELFPVLLKRIGEIAGKHLPWTAEAARELGQSSTEELRLFCKAWYLGEEQDTVKAGLIAATAEPWVERARDCVIPRLNAELWRKGTCPVCGGLPDLALLGEKVGARQLCCSRCDFSWDYSRLGCPFCGNDDPSTLAYYLGEDKFYRLYVCEACKGYLKTLDLREANRLVIPQVERILTLSMDLAAQDQGYKP